MNTPSVVSRRRARAGALLAAALVAAGGCELQELTLAEPEDLVVVEAVIQLRGDEGGRVYVVLHRTLGPGGGDVPGASVRLVRADGGVTVVRQAASTEDCFVDGAGLDDLPLRGTCYTLQTPPALAPGSVVRLEIETAEGEALEATTTVPGAFTLRRPSTLSGSCVLDADTPLELVWARSEGAWAYVAESEIFGLRGALAPLGITVESDPLYLLGLSIAASDTTIVFPTEFGVFDRFDLDRDLAVYLQGGLPPSTVSLTTVAAVDRNWVNWVRGGNFNPSGTVRVPSVRGDGTGFFGSAYVRDLRLLVDPGPDGNPYPAPRCVGGSSPP
jgi:hypothetical protein